MEYVDCLNKKEGGVMVYLICFDKKYKHAKHYIGFVDNNDGLENRIDMHKKGQGARLLQVLNENGIDYKVVRIWKEGDRNFERKLKNLSHSKELCPCCAERENFFTNILKDSEEINKAA